MDVLQSVKDASDARAYFVAAWVCAFLASLQFDAASRKEETAIMDELEALRARLACRDPSPALLAARLDVEACLRRPGVHVSGAKWGWVKGGNIRGYVGKIPPPRL